MISGSLLLDVVLVAEEDVEDDVLVDVVSALVVVTAVVVLSVLVVASALVLDSVLVVSIPTTLVRVFKEVLVVVEVVREEKWSAMNAKLIMKRKTPPHP